MKCNICKGQERFEGVMKAKEGFWNRKARNYKCLKCKRINKKWECMHKVKSFDSIMGREKVKVKFKASKEEAFPHEFYSRGKFTLYKKGDTIKFLLDGKETSKRDNMWEFFELLWFLLKAHPNDEMVQMWFLMAEKSNSFSDLISCKTESK